MTELNEEQALQIRVSAMSLAIKYQGHMTFGLDQLLQTSDTIEDYLKNGHPKSNENSSQ